MGGPMGNGLTVKTLTKTAPVQFYKEWDKRGATENPDAVKTGFEDWYFSMSGVTISGPEIKKSLGIGTKSVLTRDKSEFRQDQLDTFFNIPIEKYQQAAQGTANAWSQVLWGWNTAEFKEAPPGIPQLMDPTITWHAQNPDELGSWGKDHPWSVNPPNNLPSDNKYRLYVNVPQIYKISSDIFKKKDIDIFLSKMMTRVSGYWLAPCHPEDFEDLSNEHIGNDQGPVLVGKDTYELAVDCIKYKRAFIYIDAYATKGVINFLHIGPLNATADRDMRPPTPNEVFRPGIQLVFWMEENSDFREIRKMILELPKNPAATGAVIGTDMSIPISNDGWERNLNATDELIDNIRMDGSILGQDRWRNGQMRADSMGYGNAA